jgi:hypothetical protein
MIEKKEKTGWLNYANTILLTLVLGFVTINFTTLTHVKEDNENTQKELLRIKTIQDINTSNIQGIDARVRAIETYQQEAIKNWVDDNYIRKKQHE